MINILTLDPDVITIDDNDTDNSQFEPYDQAHQPQHVQLSVEYMCTLTGLTDLTKLLTLTLTGISTQHTSLQCINSATLPSLTSLTINQSHIGSVREFGRQAMPHLETLDLSYCDLTDIDNITLFTNLSKLNLSYNTITDISAVEDLRSLTECNFDGCSIDDIDQIDFLYNCNSLQSLSLLYNPITYLQHYRPITIAKLSHTQLKQLDTQPIINADRADVDDALHSVQRPQSEVDQIKLEHQLYRQHHSHMFYIDTTNDSQPPAEQTVQMEQFIAAMSETDMLSAELQDKLRASIRPSTAGSRPTTAHQRSTSMSMPVTNGVDLNVFQSSELARPGTAQRRPSTSLQRPGTALNRPGTALPPDVLTAIAAGSSDLTFGGDALVGSFVTAMRTRKRAQSNSQVPAMSAPTSSSAVNAACQPTRTPVLSSYSRTPSLNTYSRPTTGNSDRPGSSNSSIHSENSSRPATQQQLHRMRNSISQNQPVRASFSAIPPSRPSSGMIQPRRSPGRPISSGVTRNNMHDMTNNYTNPDEQVYIIKSKAVEPVQPTPPALQSPTSATFIQPRPPSAKANTSGRRRPSATKPNAGQQLPPQDIVA